ncbi:MAG TPA: SGNH/GDSL hydrolase family protein [Pseudoneobacillus sp.]|nr:SGNH/GDSL hydrolase family protein [Pseudoneobacillus sp.]
MKKHSVKIIFILASLCLTLFLFGFGWTLNSQFISKKTNNMAHPKAVQEEHIDKNQKIIALGDSLTRGTGDVEGKGYIGYLVDQLQVKTKEKIVLENLGVKGFRTEQLLNQVKQPGIRGQIKNADIILITIGGNDLFQGGQTILELDITNVDNLRLQYLKNLEKIISEIRLLNQDSTIFLVGLYNPFIDLKEAKLTSKAVRQWNFETSELLDNHPQTVFVPTFDLFQLKVSDYLYTDHFHPNSKGYKLIAERVASLITW